MSSIPLPLTLALLVTGHEGAVPTMVVVEEALLARVPRLHVTVPPDSEQVPWVDVTDTKTTGKESVSVTDVDVAGPLFVTVTV